MASGNRYARVRTNDAGTEAVQTALIDVLDQLEEPRRGLLVAEARQEAGNAQIGEDLFIEYVGPGGHTFTLPDTSLRGSGRAQLLLIANNGPGTLTVRPAGSQLVAMASSVTIATGAANVLWSNGGKGSAGRWARVT